MNLKDNFQSCMFQPIIKMFFKNGLEIAQIPQRVWQPRPTGGCRNRVRENFKVSSGGWSLFICLLFIPCSLMKYLLWAFSMPATVLCPWDIEMNQQFNWAPQDILHLRLRTGRDRIIIQFEEDKNQDGYPKAYKGKCTSWKKEHLSWILMVAKDFPRWKRDMMQGRSIYKGLELGHLTECWKTRIIQNSSLLSYCLCISNDDGDDFNFLITQFRLVWTYMSHGGSTNYHKTTLVYELPLCTGFAALEVCFYSGSAGWLKVTIQH